MLGREPEDLDGIGVWHLAATVGKSGHTFEVHPPPEQMTLLSRLVLHILTEDLDGPLPRTSKRSSVPLTVTVGI
jgi:hypothetical protein